MSAPRHTDIAGLEQAARTALAIRLAKDSGRLIAVAASTDVLPGYVADAAPEIITNSLATAVARAWNQDRGFVFIVDGPADFDPRTLISLARTPAAEGRILHVRSITDEPLLDPSTAEQYILDAARAASPDTVFAAYDRRVAATPHADRTLAVHRSPGAPARYVDLAC